jgi:hypothetical protein
MYRKFRGRRGRGQADRRPLSQCAGIRTAAVAAVIGVSAFVSSSCAGPRPPATPTALSVVAVDSPAGTASAEPQLTASPDGVILSWLENAGSDTRLLFAERAGGKWSDPRVVVTRRDVFANWADLPSVTKLHDARGTLVAHWLQRSAADAAGYTVQIATSADAGRSWSAPFSPHHDGTNTQHGFASFFEPPDPSSPLGLVWLDGRQTTPAKDPDDDAVGDMTLRSAGYDAAWHEQTDEPIDLRVCDCCPTAAATTSDGVLVAFRNRSDDEIRDIYVARRADGHWTTPRAVHDDGWKIDGCPVNGPALSARGRDAAVAWFTAAGDQGRALIAFSHDGGATFGAPIRVDDAGALGRVGVALFADGGAVVSWIELANRRAAIMARRIGPDGARSPAAAIADVTAHRSTVYPRMALGGGELVFAWADADELRVRTAIARLP